jgi:hypothetical protein
MDTGLETAFLGKASPQDALNSAAQKVDDELSS